MLLVASQTVLPAGAHAVAPTWHTHGKPDGVGAGVGLDVGEDVGLGVGAGVGLGVGAGVGLEVGDGVGAGVGAGVGEEVGASVGTAVGAGVGDDVGSEQVVLPIWRTLPLVRASGTPKIAPDGARRPKPHSVEPTLP